MDVGFGRIIWIFNSTSLFQILNLTYFLFDLHFLLNIFGLKPTLLVFLRNL